MDHLLWISQDFRNFLQRVMLSLVSLCSAVFQNSTPLQMKFFEHATIQSRSTFEYQKGCIIISLSSYQNSVIFGVTGSELWIFDSQPPNFTPSFYAYSFRVPAYSCTWCEWLPQRLFTWETNYSFFLTKKLVESLKPLEVVCVCNIPL
jgi:hypothetical protein